MRTCKQIVSSTVTREGHKKCGWTTFAINQWKLHHNPLSWKTYSCLPPRRQRVWKGDGEQQSETVLCLLSPIKQPGNQIWSSIVGWTRKKTGIIHFSSLSNEKWYCESQHRVSDTNPRAAPCKYIAAFSPSRDKEYNNLTIIGCFTSFSINW